MVSMTSMSSSTFMSVVATNYYTVIRGELDMLVMEPEKRWIK